MRLVPISDIVVEERQRKKITLESVQDLMASISQNKEVLRETEGLINPIVVRDRIILVAGERRLSACRYLNRTHVAALDVEFLSPDDAKIIELEENVKRSDLSWQERCEAAADIHRRLEARAPETWTQTKTAERLGVTTQSISRYLALADAMSKDASIGEAASLSTAFAILQRQQDRQFDDMITTIGESVQVGRSAPTEAPREGGIRSLSSPLLSLVGGGEIGLSPPPPLAASDTLILGDFYDWAKTYSGPRFNFIHCDFPYGAGAGRAESQINAGGDLSTYEDSPEIFYSLCQTLLDSCSNVIAPSAHIMLWFQTESLSDILAYFRNYHELLDLRTFRIPLVWHKSDNSGVVSDPSRRARHIYETAFVLSRGDRKIVRTVSDVYSCPISRGIHPAEKPQPMLEHFFQMFVSNTTRMLDPTAGGGSAIRAAESLGAAFVLGLERDEKFHSESVAELDRFRRKRQLNQLIIKDQLHEPTTANESQG